MPTLDDIVALPLSALTRRIAGALASTPGLTGVWVTAETSDLRCSGGHCYMELIDKRADGTPLAKCRAVIWASTFPAISRKFTEATGAQLRSDMKVMVLVSVSFHAVYGMTLVINDINPAFTAGDLAARRLAIYNRLKAEGVADLNRSLRWPVAPQRVAVISARGAAGYGDFVRQLHDNPRRLAFSTTLFEVALQGERTAASVIGALDAVAADIDSFDCVVIIRGGGAVADLAWFDNYDLAANVAQFPLPVIVGIGHERDVTVLDYIANTRVKTPTAAAEALLRRVGDALDAAVGAADAINTAVKRIIAARSERLAYIAGRLPLMAHGVVERNRQRVGPQRVQMIALAARNVVSRCRMAVGPERNEALRIAAANIIGRRRARLDAVAELLDALSPEATLRRGYSITRVGSHAITDPSSITPGTILTTTLAAGILTSVAK